MAKDALLTSTISLSGAPWASGAAVYSTPTSITPFGSNGANSWLFARFILSQPTYAAIPVATGTYNWQFWIQGSKDGNTWSTIASSPSDTDAFKTHMVYVQGTLAANATYLTIPHNVLATASASFTNGQSTITAAPYCNVGDIITFAATATPFATATPYYVVSSTPAAGAATQTCTIQLAASPGGTPITFTGVTGSFSISRIQAVPISIGDMYQIKGTFTAGLDGATAFTIADGDNILVTKTTINPLNTFVFFRVCTSSTTVGTANNYVQGAAASTSVSINASNLGGEFYLPIPMLNGLPTNTSGVQQDNYNLIRFVAACTFAGSINPTATVRGDIVIGRDGAYS